MKSKKTSLGWRLRRDMALHWELYLLFIPVIVYYIMFHYAPMYGAIIAFKNYKPALGIWGSSWVGLKHFNKFFNNYYFSTLIRNTLRISITNLLVGFPIPIILALLINELRSKPFARVVQTITYMPHFLSLVVICSMVREFTAADGLISGILALFGVPRNTMLNVPSNFLPIYVISGVWQQMGWNSIIYLSALTAIDQNLYEAAEIDGAGRWSQTFHVTIPGLLPTIIIMFIMQLGRIMSIGAEKVILLYNPAIYDTADVISSYVYRRGIINADWSYSTAVGLFNSVINFALVIGANKLSNLATGNGLW